MEVSKSDWKLFREKIGGRLVIGRRSKIRIFTSWLATTNKKRYNVDTT